MKPVYRKTTYRLYPTKRQVALLWGMKRLHNNLYNAALQERRDAWRLQKKSLSFSDQCKELTQLRREDPEYEAINAQSSQVTLKRLDLAFRRFFQRVKEGKEKAGFPRFKSLARQSGWGYKSHGDGFKLTQGGKDKKGRARHGRLKLSGIGSFSIRGVSRNEGLAKTCEIFEKGGRWYASVTFSCVPSREKGEGVAGSDLGVETQLSLVHESGSSLEAENPRHLRKSLGELGAAQKELSRKKRGSQGWKKAKKKVARLHQKIANQRLNSLHQLSCFLISLCSCFVTEELNVKGMTASGGSYKKGLNREILAAGFGLLLKLLQYKAAEAFCEWVWVPTRKIKPSQTCSGCGRQKKKALSERIHHCEDCGLTLGRDENAARVMLLWALGRLPKPQFGEPKKKASKTSREPSGCGGAHSLASKKHETPSHSGAAAWVE